MHLSTFKKIVEGVAALEAKGVVFDVLIRGDNEYTKGATSAYFQPAYIEFQNLAQLSEAAKTANDKLELSAKNASKLKGWKEGSLGCLDTFVNLITRFNTKKVTRSEFPSIKFIPNIPNYGNFHGLSLTWLNPSVIIKEPVEETVEENTYRYVGTNTEVLKCISNEDPLFKYMDKGFMIQNFGGRNGPKSVLPVLINEMTLDTFLCLMLMGKLSNTAIQKHLVNDCFLNANNAKVTRIRLEKEVQIANAYNYQCYCVARQTLIADYEKSANSGLIEKLLKGEIPAGTLNSIKLSKTKAQYEGIYVEAPDLLDVIMKTLVFDDRTDIYTVVRAYAQHKVNRLESYEFADGVEVEIDGKKVKPDPVNEIAENFIVNGIKVELKRKKVNTRRYVNDIPINMEEVEQVCFRASCFYEQDKFDDFVKAVDAMSLKWHDAIANGIPVKIHDTLTADEYKKDTAPPSAPKLKFRLKDGKVQLVIDDKRQVPVKLNDLMKEVAILNRKTKGESSLRGGYYTRRTAAWARQELVRILKECCTYEVRSPVMIPEKTGADGKLIPAKQKVEGGKKVFERKDVCGLTDEDAAFIEKMAREYQQKAIEKSKLFLETAIKITGAVLDEKFKGSPHYIVQGKNNKYAVNAATNEVCHFESGRHICIVEPGHQVSVGCDATAARLYALKNDAVTVGNIGTLSGYVKH